MSTMRPRILPATLVPRLAVAASVLLLLSGIAGAGASYTKNVNLGIPDAVPGQARVSKISIPADMPTAPPVINTFLVTLNINHPYPGDLDIVLLPPWVLPLYPFLGVYDDPALIPDDAIFLTKKDQTLPAGANFTNTRFTGSNDPIQKASGPLTAGSAPYNDIFNANDQQSINDIYNMPSFGDWNLIVMDTDGGDAGTLVSWSITFSDPQEIAVNGPGGPITDGASYTPATQTQNVAVAHTFTVFDLSPTKELTVSSIEVRDAVNCTATVSKPGKTIVPPSGNVAFDLTLTGQNIGNASCRLRINNDDKDEEDYDIFVSFRSWYPAPTPGVTPPPIVVGGDPSQGGFATPGDAMAALMAEGVTEPTVIELGGGSFASGPGLALTSIPPGASATNTVTIRAKPGEKAVITGTCGTAWAGGATAMLLRNTRYIVIEGIEFNGTGTGGNTSGLTIDFTTKDCVVRGCKFHTYAASAINVYQTGAGSNIKVENNVVWACADDLFIGVMFLYRADVVAVHNSVYFATAGRYAWGIGAPAPANISNNVTIVANGTALVAHEGAVSPVTCDHNVWFATGPGIVNFNSFGNFGAWQAAGNDTNGIVANPLCEDPAAGDFHLRFGSPAIDLATGATVLTDDVDVDREARPNGAERDSGADEFYETNGAEMRVTLDGTPFANGSTVAGGAMHSSTAQDYAFAIQNLGNAELQLTGSPKLALSSQFNCTVEQLDALPTAVKIGQTVPMRLRVKSFGPTVNITGNDIGITAPDELTSSTTGKFASLKAGDWIQLAGLGAANNVKVRVETVGAAAMLADNLLKISGAVLEPIAAGPAVTISGVAPQFVASIANDDSNESPFTFNFLASAVALGAPSMAVFRKTTSIPSGTSPALGNFSVGHTYRVTLEARNTGPVPVIYANAPASVTLNAPTGATATMITQLPASIQPRSMATFVVDITPAGGAWSVPFSINYTTGTYTLTLTGNTAS
ncbi:MAG: hypothetical protein AB7K09_21135, partial [Planctomycetota bacterium]